MLYEDVTGANLLIACWLFPLALSVDGIKIINSSRVSFRFLDYPARWKFGLERR